jgi:hypothetical protein
VRGILWFVLGLTASLWLSGILFTRADQPLSLRNDHLFLLVEIKSFLHGHGLRFNPSLGFPGVQDNLLFPQFDLSHGLVLYLLSRLAQSPFAIEHLFYGVAIAAMFASCFAVLRVLTVRPSLAALAAVVYVVSPYFANRSGDHDFLALYFGVPWGAGLAYLLAEQAALSDKRPRAFAVLFGACLLVAGTSGLYYAFFAAMFVGVTAVGAAIGRRDVRPLLLGALACAVLLLLVLFSGYRWHIGELFGGALPQPQRAPIENLYYGLLLSDAVHVFNDIGLFADRFAHYAEAMKSIPGADANFRYEWPGPLLSTVILAAPAFLLAALFDRTGARSTHGRLIWLSLFLIAFGLIFALRGGLGFHFSYFITPAIRAPARIMPYLAFFALVAVCCAIELLLARPAPARIAAAAIVATLLAGGLAIRPFPLATKQQAMLAERDLMDDQTSVAAMLARKDQAGLRRILQLPHAKWPEVPPVRGFAPYRHQMPYVLDRPDSATRWSYGLTPEQPPFGALGAMIGEGHIAAGARSAGFDAILIEKRAYSDEELHDLIGRIESNLAPGCRLFEDARRVLFALDRPANPASCPGAS